MARDAHEISAAHVGDDLRRAFATAAKRGARRVELRISAELRATADFANQLVSVASAMAGLEELVLVHPSSAFGFLASMLQLRLSGVTVRALERAESSGWLEANSEGAPRAGEAASTIVRLSASADSIEARRSISKLRSCRSCTVVFDPSTRPQRACVDGIVEAVNDMPALEEITLVHDSPSIGFLASSLSLKAPRVVVRTASRRDAGVD